MKTKAATGFIIASCVGVLLIFIALLRNERRNHEATVSQLVDARKQIAELTARSKQVAASISSLENSARTTPVPNRPLDAKSKLEAKEESDLGKPVAIFGVPLSALENVEARELYLKSQVVKMEAGWERFFAERNLTHEQRLKVLELGRESFERNIDLAAAVWAQGLAENSPDVANLRRQMGDNTTAELLKSLRSNLGEQLFQEFTEYQQANRSRQVTDELASRLYFRDAPMTGEQARRVEFLLKPTQFGPKAGSGSGVSVAGIAVSRVDYVAYESAQRLQQQPALALISDAALSQAASFLAPTQLAALKRLQTEQLNLINLARIQKVRTGPE